MDYGLEENHVISTNCKDDFFAPILHINYTCNYYNPGYNICIESEGII